MIGLIAKTAGFRLYPCHQLFERGGVSKIERQLPLTDPQKVGVAVCKAGIHEIVFQPDELSPLDIHLCIKIVDGAGPDDAAIIIDRHCIHCLTLDTRIDRAA